MDTLVIEKHSPAGWQEYADTFGFVPDPMILRAGEVFLNGEKGTQRLKRDPMQVWEALEANIGGLIDFFDILVTRDRIPLINYEDTFDPSTTEWTLSELPGEQARRVKVSNQVYNTIKKGALERFAEFDPPELGKLMGVIHELDAVRYDWELKLDVVDGSAGFAPVRAKLAAIKGHELSLARFLVGGLIFNGFAKASDTIHYIQPKRSRFLLGVTAAPDKIKSLSRGEEAEIFDTAEARFKENNIHTQRTEALPPVLPYLLTLGGKPNSPRELLDRALAFRKSGPGVAYYELAKTIRAGGIEASRGRDLAQAEQRKAIEFLEPYSKLDPKQSASLDITIGVPGASAKTPVRLPTCVRVWLNDYVPFGGVRKTLRRMWMDAQAYRNVSSELRTAWGKA
jgi:hypothetical protein